MMSSMRALLVMTLLSFVSLRAPAFQWKDLWMTPEQQGKTLMQKGAFKEAEEKFEAFDWKGVAAYRGGDYQKAATYYGTLGTAENDYNQGNALAHLGRYEEALKAYEKALSLNPDHEDAQYNREKIKQYLKNASNQPQPMNQNQENQKEKDSKGSESSSEHSKQEGDTKEEKDKGNSTREEQREARNNQDQGKKQDTKQSTKQDVLTSTSEEEKKKDSKDAQLTEQGENKSPEEQDSTRSEEMKAENKKDPNKKDPSTKQKASSVSTKNASLPENKDELGESVNRKKEEQNTRQVQAQWLRLIPDDPGGLLREKFLREHQRRGQHDDQDDQYE